MYSLTADQLKQLRNIAKDLDNDQLDQLILDIINPTCFHCEQPAEPTDAKVIGTYSGVTRSLDACGKHSLLAGLLGMEFAFKHAAKPSMHENLDRVENLYHYRDAKEPDAYMKLGPLLKPAGGLKQLYVEGMRFQAYVNLNSGEAYLRSAEDFDDRMQRVG